MIRFGVLACLGMSLVLHATCAAQEVSLLKKLEIRLAAANQHFRQEKLLIAKQLDDKSSQQLVSFDSFDQAIEQVISVRVEIEAAIISRSSEPGILKGSSLQGASPKQIRDWLRSFTDTTWSTRKSFADHLIRTGQVNKAVCQLETTLEGIEATLGLDHVIAINVAPKLKMAKWLQNASESEVKQFQKIEAEKSEALQLLVAERPQESADKWTLVLQQLESLGLTDSYVYAESLANGAEALLMLKDLENAQKMFERAIKKNDVVFKKKCLVNANLRRSYSTTFQQRKKYAQAIAVLDETDKLYQALDPEPTLDRAIAIHMKGKNFQFLKDYEQATRLYFEAVDMLVVANENRLFGTLEKSIGESFDAMIDPAGAPADMAGNAVETGKRIFADSNPIKTIDWLLTIAKIKRGQNKPAQSAAIYEKTEAFFHRVPDYKKQKSYASCVIELCEINVSNKEWDVAAKYADLAVESTSAIFGSRHLVHGRTLISAGKCHSANANYDKAERCLAEGLKIVVPIFYPAVGKKEWLAALRARAANLQAAKRWEEAIPIWKRLDTLPVEDKSVEQPFRKAIVQGLIESYRSTDRLDLAGQHAAELSE